MGRRLVKGGDLATHDADRQQPRVLTSLSAPSVLKKQKVFAESALSDTCSW